MLKSKVKFITITFLIFVVSFSIVQNNYGKYFNEEITNWRVVITSDTKELKDTQEIKFKVEDNSNVVNGKIAPGLKDRAGLEIDFSDFVGMADIQLLIDDSSLLECFKLKVKLDGETYEPDSIRTIYLDGNNQIKKVFLEIEWLGNNNELDTSIGVNINELKIPITVNVSQHI